MVSPPLLTIHKQINAFNIEPIIYLVNFLYRKNLKNLVRSYIVTVQYNCS
ncbi:unnamed protein product, partial [Staurois parvus]